MSKLREAFRPVPDRDLPNLSRFILRTNSAFAILGAIAGSVYGLVSLLYRGYHGPLLLLNVVIVSGFGLDAWLSTLSVNARHAEKLVFVTALLLMVAFMSDALLVETNSVPISEYTIVAPLLVGVIMPWRPRWSIALGLVGMIVPLLLIPEHIALPVPFFVFLGISFAIFAAVGNQLVRLLWQQLEGAKRQLVAADRMSSLGAMVAGIAHELNTPSAAASHSLDQMRTLSAELRESIGKPEVTEDDFREIVREMDAATATCTRAVERSAKFVQAIRSQTLGMNAWLTSEFEVRARVEEVLALLEHRARTSGVEVLVEETGAAVLRGDPTKFDQVAMNLIGNAIDACTAQGRDTHVHVSAVAHPGGVLFAVQDDGPGIDPSIRERVFEALFTTRRDGGGTGLGLSISRSIMEGTFGGTLSLGTSERGARFEAWFPHGGANLRDEAAWAPAERPSLD